MRETAVRYFKWSLSRGPWDLKLATTCMCL